jgi:hypothetical protein
VNDRIGIKSQYIKQNIKQLRPHAAVPEERVDGVVPLKESVAVLQRLLGLVVPRDAVRATNNIKFKNIASMTTSAHLMTWNQWEAMSRQMSSAAARVNSGYRLLSITKKPAVEILNGRK